MCINDLRVLLNPFHIVSPRTTLMLRMTSATEAEGSAGAADDQCHRSRRRHHQCTGYDFVDKLHFETTTKVNLGLLWQLGWAGGVVLEAFGLTLGALWRSLGGSWGALEVFGWILGTIVSTLGAIDLF